MQTLDREAIRVFLVDDHQTTLWGLERLIESAAPKMQLVGTACRRRDMLAQVPPARPDVVVLDIDLGGESSLEALPDLLRDTDAQVVMLTGVRDSQVHERAMLAGARGVVQKEASADHLLEAIEKVSAGDVWLDPALLGNVLRSLTNPRHRPSRDPDAEKIASLTGRERQIIAAVVREKGAKNKVIADHVHISEHTLRNHLSVIYDKLGLSGRLELFLFASEHGLANAAPAVA
jgi:two-component system nitrate/nitrite response regulator NarL